MGFDLKTWYNEKRQGEIVLEYNGTVTSDIITDTLAKFESNDSFKSERNKIRKKVYNVLVECLQNLYHHVDIPPEEMNIRERDNYGAIVLSKDGTFYRISTGNFVRKEKISYIKDRIDQVNSLSDEEVKLLYREILNNEEFSEKGGGGLGMLDIVRKTGNKLEYYFFQVDDEYIFFSLDVYIS
jgi:hypothetical protein